jgi:hypothetical protein
MNSPSIGNVAAFWEIVSSNIGKHKLSVKLP